MQSYQYFIIIKIQAIYSIENNYAGSSVLGRSEYASESGRVGRPVRCGELKKGMGSYPEGYQFSNQTHRGVRCTVQTGSAI